jgi:tetratricopeptide (TPR) repeat protein
MRCRSLLLKYSSLYRVVLATIAALIVVSGCVFASPYSDGNTAYKAKDYTTAASDFQKAVSASTGVEKAKAYYKLGLTYRKEQDTTNALKALQSAQSTDPTLSFASSPQKFQDMLASVQTGAATLPSGAATPSAPGLRTDDAASTALSAADVYVDPPMASYVNAPTLAEAAASDDHTKVKIAVLKQLPRGVDTAAHYAAILYKHLNLGKNAIIVYSAYGHDGQPGGIGVDAGTYLGASDATALADKYVAQIGSGNNLTAGLSALASATSAKLDSKEMSQTMLIWEIVGIIILIVVIFLVISSRKKKAEMAALRAPLTKLREQILQNIEYIDNYADVLPKNNVDSDEVKAYRQAAEAKFELADKILMKATDPSDLYRAQSILDKATADITKARQFLDRATGGTSKIAGDAAVRPADIPSTVSEAQAVPHEQRGVSFFSSQPAPMSSLVPVTLNIDGQTRTVMATPEEADQIRLGQVPPVRAFNNNGQMVPWYNYQNYDPYRDYYQYQNQGWGGFGSGAVAGFIGAEMLDSLFTPHNYGGWYSPYGYSPGFGSFGGWNDYGYNSGGYDQGFMAGEQRADNLAFNDQYNQPGFGNAGGSSFSGQGTGYDTSDYGNSGGASFTGGGGGDRS